MSVSLDIRVNNVSVKSYLNQCSNIPIVFRNRDWKPVFDGFSFQVDEAVTNPPLKNQSVIVYGDSDSHYLGYIEKLNYNDKTFRYEVEVTNELMKLDKHRLRYSELHDYLNDTADFTGAKTFTVNTSTDRFLCTGHGLSEGDVIQVKSTGTLPAPLESKVYYWIRVDDANTVRLYKDHSDYVTGTPVINFTDTGSGTHTFAFADWNKYAGAFSYNATYGHTSVNACASLSWIVKKMFQIAGLALDTSLVDGIILHKFTIDSVEYDWTWNEIYLDENMMFCLNQNKAINPYVIDDDTDYIDSQITFLEFIQDIFGKIGFNAKFIGTTSTKTYLLVPQARDIDGVITPDDEDNFVIADSDKLDYKDYVIVDDGGGYSHSRTFNTNRALYSDPTEYDLEEYTGKVRTQAGRKRIDWFTNLRFLLQDQTLIPYSSGWLVNPNTFGYEFYNITYYSAIRNQVYSLLNHQHEEISCPADYLSDEKWAVKELYLVIKEEQLKIIQEQNLLASG